MKKYIIIWLISFITLLVIKIIGNKFIGRMYTYSKPLKWDQIINEFPISILYAIIGAFLIALAFSLDRKSK